MSTAAGQRTDDGQVTGGLSLAGRPQSGQETAGQSATAGAGRMDAMDESMAGQSAEGGAPMGGADEPVDPLCLRIDRINGPTIFPPAGIRVGFRLLDCEGRAVRRLLRRRCHDHQRPTQSTLRRGRRRRRSVRPWHPLRIRSIHRAGPRFIRFDF